MSTNIETVQQIYAAFGRGDVQSILGCFSPDIEWEHDWCDCEVPWMKPRRGVSEVARYFAELDALEIELHYLATWRDVLEAARASGYFTAAQAQEVERFLERPARWSLEHGGIAAFPEGA